MIGSFRHKGLAELYRSGKTRPVGAVHVRITFGWSGQDALDIDLEDYH